MASENHQKHGDDNKQDIDALKKAVSRMIWEWEGSGGSYLGLAGRVVDYVLSAAVIKAM